MHNSVLSNLSKTYKTATIFVLFCRAMGEVFF
jgi:hypothetical protein